MKSIPVTLLIWIGFLSGIVVARTAGDAPVPLRQDDSQPTSATDEALLKELVPGIPLGKPGPQSDRPAEVDVLDKTIRSMRRASDRIEQEDLSDETRTLQLNILTSIDALIDRLETQPPPSKQPPAADESGTRQPQREPPADRSEKSRDPSQSPASTKQSAGTGSGDQTGPANRTDNPDASDSSEENRRKASVRQATLARRRALINEVWGHLPPALREKLLNVGSEKLLPQYEELIRRYYESLANTPESSGR